MEKIWNILPEVAPENSLAEILNIPKAIANILNQRGIKSFEEAEKFFNPCIEQLHPFSLLKDISNACERINEAIIRKEKILIYGDYDVDGTTSVAILYQFLCSLYSKEKIDFYIPNRYTEGYGIGEKGISFAIEHNFNLVISVDCGIKSASLIQTALDEGIDFIICDHHLPDNEIPPAKAILNPKQHNCNYPYKDLCGCGVTYKLITALCKFYNLDEQNHLKYLDLVAIATAADIVSMTGENRALAYLGLKKINQNPSPAIKAICEISKASYPLTITDVVFILAPRINAAGRIDDSRKVVNLFNCNDYEEAKNIAALINNDNTYRKTIDKSITDEALQIIQSDERQISKKTSVVYNENWSKGVVGIVASRLTETYYRPTIVLTKSGEVIAGSARSVEGFNLYEAVHGCREHLLGYGGHFAAAGLTLLPEKIKEFAEKFEKIVSETIEPEMLIPKITIDSEISFRDITLRTYKVINRMEPFGPGNMKPVFIARNVVNGGFSKIVKEEHLKLHLIQEGIALSGIGFNLKEKADCVLSNSPVDIVFTLDENEWNGVKSIQLKVIDIRRSA